MLELNLPAYHYRLKKEGGKLYIYDQLRKKYLVLTPEEWVRQHFLNFLISHKKVPKSLIREEALLSYHQLQKRADILVYSRRGNPLLLVECKASTEKLDEDVFLQLSTYNFKLNVPYVIMTNGLTHYYARKENDQYNRIPALPEFNEM